ncbi:MAG: hypothetical protein AAGD14_06570 [Planctomycetota bacterium]
MEKALVGLLCLAGLAGAQEHTLDQIVEIMRQREQATTRYHACYTYDFSWNGRPAPTLSFTGFYSRDGNRVFWRGARLVDDPFKGTFHQEEIVYRNGLRTVKLDRPRGTSTTDWRAFLQSGPPWDGPVNPDYLGIRHHVGFYSDAVARPGTIIVGREKVGSFACVKVVHGLGPTPVPEIAWLAVDHAYFPVRVTWTFRPKSATSAPAEVEKMIREGHAWRVADGSLFEARAIHTVEALTPVDAGLIPTRVRTLQPRAEHMPMRGEALFTVTPTSIVPGSKLTEDYFTLQHVDSAEVRGPAVPEPPPFGSRSIRMTRDEIRDHIELGTPVVRDDPPWLLMVFGGITLLLGIVLAVMMRRR